MQTTEHIITVLLICNDFMHRGNGFTTWIISSLKAGILCLLKDKPPRVIDSPLCAQQALNQYFSTRPSTGGAVSGLQTLVCRNKGIQGFRSTVYVACLGSVRALISPAGGSIPLTSSHQASPTVLPPPYPSFHCHTCRDSCVQQLKQLMTSTGSRKSQETQPDSFH